MILPNYDPSRLRIEVDDATKNDGDPWDSFTTSFTSISITRSVSVDSGALFRPESGTMTITTKDVGTWALGGITNNRVIRVRYINPAEEAQAIVSGIIFKGTVREVNIDAEPGDPHEPVNYRVTIHCTDSVQDLNNTVLQNFTRSSEGAPARAIAAYPPIYDSSTLTGTTMAAVSGDSPTALSVLQDVSDACLARFYTDAWGKVHLNASAVAEPTIHFSDDPNDPNGISFSSVQIEQKLENSITKVVAYSPASETVLGSASIASPKLKNEKTFTIGIPATTTALNAWAAKFPLKDSTFPTPASINAGFDERLVKLELLNLISLSLDTESYAAGVRSITHNVTPYRWNMSFGLIPGHILGYDPVIPPSAPTHLTARAVDYTDVFSGDYAGEEVQLDWDPPVTIANTTHYTVRSKIGSSPSTSFADGQWWGDTVNTNLSGLYFPKETLADPSKRVNTFTVWARTEDDNVYSPPAWVTITLTPNS